MRVIIGSLAVLIALVLPQICMGQPSNSGTTAGTPGAPIPSLGPDDYFSSTGAMQQALLLLPAPPQPNSDAQGLNVQLLNTVIATATPTMKANAQATANFSVFDFSDVLGPEFTAKNMPVTNAFFDKVTINTVNASNYLKSYYNSPGPQSPETYPSTQTMMGFNEGVLLGLMVPEKQNQLQTFGVQEGLNRLIVNAHWPTDVVGGQMLSSILLPDMFASANFQSDFNAAKKEVRTGLGLK